jgi:hypothetical protein
VIRGLPEIDMIEQLPTSAFERPLGGLSERQRFALESEVAAILRERAALLAGVEVSMCVEPPGLRVGLRAADDLRRGLRLALSAAIVGPPIARLEISARAQDGRFGSPVLFVAARAELEDPDPTGAEAASRVERLLERRAAQTIRALGGALVVRRTMAGELRIGLDVDLEESVSERPWLKHRGRERAVVATPCAHLGRGVAAALAAVGFAVERVAGASDLLARLEPSRRVAGRATCVVIDSELLRRTDAASAPLIGAVLAAGVPAAMIVVAESRFAAARAATPTAPAWPGWPVRLEAPASGTELMALVARAREAGG